MFPFSAASFSPLDSGCTDTIDSDQNFSFYISISLCVYNRALRAVKVVLDHPVRPARHQNNGCIEGGCKTGPRYCHVPNKKKELWVSYIPQRHAHIYEDRTLQ